MHRIEKFGQVVIKPRRRILQWTLVGPGPVPPQQIWSARMDYPVLGVSESLVNSLEYTQAASISAVVDNSYFYDSENKLLYIGDANDPGLNNYAGVTVKFLLTLSAKDFVGPSDPIDSTSYNAEWLPGLISLPQSQNGSSDTLYGFVPLSQAVIRYSNADGLLNEILHDTSFNFSEVSAYVSNYIDGKFASSLKVFLGFTSNIFVDSDNILSISTVDYNRFFSREYDFLKTRPSASHVRYTVATFPLLEPAAYANGLGKEWFIREVHGMVDGFRPVNVDYNVAASTSNNRKWLTHSLFTGTPGSIFQMVDNAMANTATRTFLTTVPVLNVGDWVIIVNNGVTYRTVVNAVNRISNYIDHPSLGARTFTAADTLTRYDIARVIIEDRDGVTWQLHPGRDYISIGDAVSTNGLLMENNWEAAIGYTHSIFDPAFDNIYVRVYGRKDIDLFQDASPVGLVSENGGIRAEAISLLYQAISDSSFPLQDIDISTFDTAGDSSHDLGYAIPSMHDASKLPKFIDIILPILSSMMWRLSFIQFGADMKLGLIENGPQPGVGYSATEEEYYNYSYNHDYSDLYDTVSFNYFKKERTSVRVDLLLPNVFVNASNYIARDLHQVTSQYSASLLQYDKVQAQKMADRYAIVLGDRRAFYEINLGDDFIDKTNLSATYQISKEQLPGFDFEFSVNRQRTLSLIEVQKSTNGVTIKLEDQKAIQDRAGEW